MRNAGGAGLLGRRMKAEKKRKKPDIINGRRQFSWRLKEAANRPVHGFAGRKAPRYDLRFVARGLAPRITAALSRFFAAETPSS